MASHVKSPHRIFSIMGYAENTTVLEQRHAFTPEIRDGKWGEFLQPSNEAVRAEAIWLARNGEPATYESP